MESLEKRSVKICVEELGVPDHLTFYGKIRQEFSEEREANPEFVITPAWILGFLDTVHTKYVEYVLDDFDQDELDQLQYDLLYPQEVHVRRKQVEKEHKIMAPVRLVRGVFKTVLGLKD